MRRSWLVLTVVAYLGTLAAVIHAQPVQNPRGLTPEIRTALEQVYARALPAAVRIETVPEGTGSGFFISADGLVMTAYHVVEDSRSLRVINSKNESFVAELAGYDEFRDIAILRARANAPSTSSLTATSISRAVASLKRRPPPSIGWPRKVPRSVS